MSTLISVGTVSLLAIGLFVNGSPNSRGPDRKIEARSLTEVFKVKQTVGDTMYKLFNLMNNFVWCGKPSCPDYPGKTASDVMYTVPDSPDTGKEVVTHKVPDVKPSDKPAKITETPPGMPGANTSPGYAPPTEKPDANTEKAPGKPEETEAKPTTSPQPPTPTTP